MTVTIWDKTATAGAGGIARVATPVHTPDPQDPEAPGTAEIVYGPPLKQVSGGKWSRPHWSDAMKAAPHLHGDNFVDGWVILRDVLVTPALGADEVRGDLGATPVVDLEALTATWTYGVAAKPLATRKTAMLAAIKARAVEKIAAGFVYDLPGNNPADPHTYQIDSDAQGNMLAIYVEHLDGAVSPHGGYWRDKSNSNVAMAGPQNKAFLEAAKAYKMAIIRRAQALVDATVAAADHVPLDLIDVAAGTVGGAGGWPA